MRFREPAFAPLLPALPPLILLLLLTPLFRLEAEALEEPRELAEQTEATADGATLTDDAIGGAGEAEGTMGPIAF